MEDGALRNATKLWGQVEERIGNLTDNVDWSVHPFFAFLNRKLRVLWIAISSERGLVGTIVLHSSKIFEGR